MVNLLKRLKRDQSGVTMIEYGLIIAVISFSAVAAATVIGDDIRGVFESANDAMDLSDEEQLGQEAGGDD